jgi:hypothetical protein
MARSVSLSAERAVDTRAQTDMSTAAGINAFGQVRSGDTCGDHHPAALARATG